jgi:hypothetical protein
LERRAGEKRASLLKTFVNYGCKKFYNIGPLTAKKPKQSIKNIMAQCYKTFFFNNL